MPNDETLKPDQEMNKPYHYNMDVLVPISPDRPDEMVSRRCAGYGCDGIRVLGANGEIEVYSEAQMNIWNPDIANRQE
jgi:hypothetical protein